MRKKIQIIISLAFSVVLLYTLSSQTISAQQDPFATIVCCDANARNAVNPGPGEECAPPSLEQFYCDYTPLITDLCCDSGANNYTPVDQRDIFSPYQCHTNEPVCSYKTKVCSIETDPNYRNVINGDTEEYSDMSPPCSQYTTTSCTITALFTKTSNGIKINGEAMRTFNVVCGSIDQVVAATALANIAAAAASPSTPLNVYQSTGGVVLYKITTKDYCPYQDIPGDDMGVPIGYTKNSQNDNCVLDCGSINQIPSTTGYGCMEPTIATCGTATSTGPYSYAPTQNLCEYGSASPTPVTTNSNTYSWTCTDHNNITGTTTASCSTPRDTSCGNLYCEDLCSNIGGTQTQYYLDNHIPPMYTYTYTENHPVCTPQYQTVCTLNPDTGVESCTEVNIGDSCVDNYQTLSGCREEDNTDYCLNYSGIQSKSFISANNLTRDQYGMCWGTNGSCGPAINSSTTVPPTAGHDGYNLCLPTSTITDPVAFNATTNKYEWSCTTTQGNQTSSCSSDMGCGVDQKDCNGVCIPKSQQCGNTPPAEIISSVKVNPKVIRNSGDKCIVTWNTLKSSGNDTLVCTFDKSLSGITESATGSTTSSWRRIDVTTGDHTINCTLTTESDSKVVDSGTVRCSENPKFIEF